MLQEHISYDFSHFTYIEASVVNSGEHPMHAWKDAYFAIGLYCCSSLL
jgi:hypothetical protein